MLTREQLLQKRSRPVKEIHVEGLGGSVLIQGLTTSERSHFEASLQNKKGKVDRSKVLMVRERLIVRCVVDANGKQLLTDDDMPLLSEQPAAIMEQIFNACQELSGFSDQDIESLEKNSGRTPPAEET